MNEHLERAMRYAQLTICEGDVGNFDPDQWLRYLEECKCDGLVLGSGGYIAYHDTDIPHHYRVKHPAHEDVFGYMVAAVRKKGYAVICRTDSHALHEDAFQAHPEWAARTKDGKPRRHWSYSAVYVSCPLGPYGFEFMREVHGELARKYDLDAIFCNRWPGSGVCYCDACRENFRAFCGREIPESFDDPSDETVRLYRKWHEKRAFELCRCWDEEIQKNNPKMRFVPNSSVGTEPFIDNKLLGDYAEVLYADYQGRSGLMTPWFNGRTAKELRAVLGDKPIGGIFSTGTCEKRWKDSVQEKAELELWISEAVANGLRPWFTKFSVQVFDERWMPVVKSLYNKYYRWEKYLRHTRSRAEVALMFSQQTVKEYAFSERERLVEKPINGWYQALEASGIPFDMLDSHDIDAEHLVRYKAVILPNIAVLSAEDCRALQAYVCVGGALLASYETSLVDENGKRRADFGLSQLFGLHANGRSVRNEQNAYISMRPGIGDPILSEGFFGETGAPTGTSGSRQEDAALEEHWTENLRLVGTENRVGISYNPDDFESSPYCAVPAFPDLPMEEVYPREVPADYEEVFFRKYGAGRVVYFPGDLDRAYWDYLLPDHRKLLRNSVRWAIGGDDPIRLYAAGFIDVTVFENEEGVIIHLVNMTTVHAMRGPAEEILPVSDLKLEIRNDLVGSGDFQTMEGTILSVTRDETYTTVRLDRLELHEMIICR